MNKYAWQPIDDPGGEIGWVARAVIVGFGGLGTLTNVADYRRA